MDAKVMTMWRRRRDEVVSSGTQNGGGYCHNHLAALIAMYFGVDPAVVLNHLPSGAQTPTSHSAPRQKLLKNNWCLRFGGIGDTEDAWQTLFKQMGKTYQEPTLVLFSGAVQSACGFADAAVGPFYCPADKKVYIDLSFYQDLKQRFHSPGDFAQAYVIAHEIGHHVQKLLGISDKVHAASAKLSEVEANKLSVKIELQADCLAGVWANHTDKTKHILEKGDMEEALNAASNIGDDRLQKQARGQITPDSFTHGTSEQRMRWFKRGFDAGNMSQCDTFSAAKL
ncbi:MAG: neutral zinc metallopeptidase [Thiotrichaceae bacterium]